MQSPNNRSEVQSSFLSAGVRPQLVSRLPAGGKQQQQQRMRGAESSSQNWGQDKCTERRCCDILPSRNGRVQLCSTCVDFTIPLTFRRLTDTFIWGTEGILHFFKPQLYELFFKVYPGNSAQHMTCCYS